MKRRAPRTGLTEEERALWRRVAETARPLRAAAPDVDAPAMASAPAAQAPARPRVAPAPGAAQPLRPPGRPEPPVAWRVSPGDRPGPVTANTPGLDRGTARRLGRGRIAPQARLDLHGMTAARAHDALSHFIAASAAGGLRCVLVVTGKGRDERGGRGEGVLRRDTPRWLATAPLAAMVIGVFEAHQRHGGGGALYVYLRRRR